MAADLNAVLDKLRANESLLRGLGALHVGVFGSVARGDQGPESDIDVLVELDPAKRLDLYGYVRLQLDIAELLGGKVDVVNRAAIKPLIRDEILADAVNAF